MVSTQSARKSAYLFQTSESGRSESQNEPRTKSQEFILQNLSCTVSDELLRHGAYFGFLKDTFDGVCKKEMSSFEFPKFLALRFSFDAELFENGFTQSSRTLFVVKVHGPFPPGRRLGEEEDLDAFWLPSLVDLITLEWKIGKVDCISIFWIGLRELSVAVQDKFGAQQSLV